MRDPGRYLADGGHLAGLDDLRALLFQRPHLLLDALLQFLGVIAELLSHLMNLGDIGPDDERGVGGMARIVLVEVERLHAGAIPARLALEAGLCFERDALVRFHHLARGPHLLVGDLLGEQIPHIATDEILRPAA